MIVLPVIKGPRPGGGQMDWSNMDILFFKAALAAYLAATVGYLVSLVAKRVVLAKASTWILGLAVALHTVHFLFVFSERGVNIAVNLFEAMSFFAWIVAGAYLALQIRTKTRVLGAIVAPFAVLLMMLASLSLEGTLAIPDALQGRLVPIHVTLSIIGEGLFALASLSGVMYCIQDRQIRQRRMGPLARYLPSLGDLDNINHAGLLWGFPASHPGAHHGVSLGQDGLGREQLGDGPEDDLVLCRVVFLRLSAASAARHRLEREEDRRAVHRGPRGADFGVYRGELRELRAPVYLADIEPLRLVTARPRPPAQGA